MELGGVENVPPLGLLVKPVCVCRISVYAHVAHDLQESYVWEMYLKQNWDFFPVGDCFRKQEERKEHPKKQLPHIQPPPRHGKTRTK